MEIRVAVLGPADHEVFGVTGVGELLEGKGIGVTYHDPEVYHGSDLDRFDGVICKKTREQAFRSLRDTETPSLNGFVTHLIANHNPASYWHLSEAGVKVPDWSVHEWVEGEAVVKPKLETMKVEPFLADVSDLHQDYLSQQFIENGGVDYKVYATKNREVNVSVLKCPSKLNGEVDGRRRVEALPEIQDISENVVEQFDARLLGLDLIETGGEFYGVDVNTAPSFREADQEVEIAEAVEYFLGDD